MAMELIVAGVGLDIWVGVDIRIFSMLAVYCIVNQSRNQNQSQGQGYSIHQQVHSS